MSPPPPRGDPTADDVAVARFDPGLYPAPEDAAHSSAVSFKLGSGGGGDGDVIYVGLARLYVAKNDRDRVKNDVILQMAIRDVAETLYVFLDAADAHTAANYTSELLSVAWDLAASLLKPTLQVHVVSGATAPHAWDDLLALLDLGAVYGEHHAAHRTAKWLPRHGLLPVAVRAPDAELAKYFAGGVSYFDDPGDGCFRHPLVIVNGTFDRLHSGHKRLLALAVANCTERLVVGVTAAPQLLDEKPFPALIQPLAARKRAVREFVASLNAAIAVECLDVEDPWGPALACTDTRVLVVVSSSDVPQCHALRVRRGELGISAVRVRVARRTDRSTLSSSRIRAALAAAAKAE